jgi:glycosyltransferase involved in cell wall biosynthesis
MKILWVKNDFLHPTTRGGQIRSLEILKRLHARHEIHYLAFADPDQPEGPERSRGYATCAYPITRRLPRRGSTGFAAQAAANLFSRLPLAVSRYRSAAMRGELARLLGSQRFDSVVCDFPFPAPHFANLKGVVLFAHNVETRIWERHAALASDPFRRAYFRAQARRMEAFERGVCASVGRVVAVSEPDARVLRERLGAHDVHWAPTGVDGEYFSPRAAPPGAELVFVGAMDWMPNLDGARFLLDEIYPRIARRRPRTTVALVGRVPPAWLVARANSQVQVTGTVPDVRPYLWGARISVVPLRIGGGTRLKIYEAMAAGTPVVSTTVGAEGLDVHPPHDIRIADTADDLAETCLDLLDSDERRRHMAEAARGFVAGHCSWERAAADFEALLETGPRP